MTSALVDALQVWGFQDDFAVFVDTSVGFCLELTPIDPTCWNDDQRDAFAKRLAGFLNSVPSGTDLQWIKEIERAGSSLFSKSSALVSGETKAIAASLHRERVELLTRLEEQGGIPNHRHWLLVRVPPEGARPRRIRLFSGKDIAEEVTRAFITRQTERAASIKRDITNSLTALGLATREVDVASQAEILYRQWNPTRRAPLGNFDPEDIRTGILFTDALLMESGFSLGPSHHRVLSLSRLPESTTASMTQSLNQLPLGARLFVSIHVPDQQKELENLQLQRRVAFSMARGKGTGVSDLESEAKLGDIESLLSELMSQGEKVLQFSLNVVLRSEDPSELDALSAQTMAVLRELGGAEAMEESLASFDIFAELSFPNARARERARRLKTSNGGDFLPVFGPWLGHETPRILVRGPEGNLVSLDPFDPGLPNYNQLIAGGSGSGKSFLANLLLLQMLKEAPRVFIIDIGGSYRKLCESLGGQYIPFSPGADWAMNPFDLPAEQVTADGPKIKFLVGLIEMMTKEDGTLGLGRLEKAAIEEAIMRLYATQTEPRLSSLKALLAESAEEPVRRIAKILSSWCGNTPFGRYLDAPTNVALRDSIVSFDLKGLESFPDLQAVCLFLITDFVWRQVQIERDRKKIVIFDECWRLLQSSSGASFIAEVFRTFRKYFASAIAISQNIDDFAKSTVSEAILSNTSLRWILSQGGADRARLRQVLQLNEREAALVDALHQVKGSYAQALLITDSTRTVVQIEPTPLEYWVATTDPRDLAELDRRHSASPSVSSLERLRSLALELPRGVSGTRRET